MKNMWRLLFIFVVLFFCLKNYAQQDTLKDNRLSGCSISYFNIGDSLENKYNYQEALKWYTKSYDLDSNLCSVRRIAQCFMKRGEYEQSKHYLNLIPLDSLTHSDLRFKYNLYMKVSEIDSAFILGKEILNKYPYDGDILSSLASNYNKNEMPDSALYLINNYRLNDSTNIFVNRQLAFSYYLKKEYSKALKEYNNLLSLNDASVQTYYYLGLCYAELDSLNQAYDNLYIANEKEKDNPYILSQLGLVSIKVGFKDDGVKYIQDAISLYMPDNNLLFGLYDAISDAYFSRRKYYDCIENLKKCIELNPSYLYTYYKIAQTYGLAKNLKNEKKYYTEFLKRAKEANEISKTMNLFIDEAERRLKYIKEDEFFKNGIPNER